MQPLRECALQSQRQHVASLGLEYGGNKHAIPDCTLRRYVANKLGVDQQDVDMETAKANSVLARTIVNAALDQESLGIISNRAANQCSETKSWLDIIEQEGNKIQSKNERM